MAPVILAERSRGCFRGFLCLAFSLIVLISGCTSPEAEEKRVNRPVPASAPQRTPMPEDRPTAGSVAPHDAPVPAAERKDSVVPKDAATGTTGSRPVPRGPVRGQASTLREGPAGSVSVEKITGYRMPGEYLVFSSRHYPNALAVVTLPSDYEQHPDKQYPLVLVFGGAGECAKPPRTGALAWMHYYKMDEAMEALGTNRLESKDFRGLAQSHEIGKFNDRLRRHPYEGAIVVCPYSPLLLGPSGLDLPDYERFVIEELYPELLKRYRIVKNGIGVDGVSMGGSRSMYYGFKYPESFSSIGSLQGAFGPFLDQYRELIERNASLLRKKRIQLVTSDGDGMAPSVERFHRMLVSYGIPHEYLTLTGPHDYIFNQGPGVLALLLFHAESVSGKKP